MDVAAAERVDVPAVWSGAGNGGAGAEVRVRVQGDSELRAKRAGHSRHQSRLAEARQKTRARFLATLAGPAAGSIPDAARAVGISRGLPHAWAHRDPAFAAKMAEAKAVGELVRLDEIEAEIERRAVKGYEEPVYQKGIRVGTIRKFSDLLLMFRAKKLNPAYRDNSSPFLNAALAGRVRMVLIDPDGTHRLLEIGDPDPIVALPAPRGGNGQEGQKK